MRGVVWTRSLTDGRPTVHDLQGSHQREATAEEKVGAWGDTLLEGDEAAGRRLTVLATTCGVAVDVWLVEDVPTGVLRRETYERIVRNTPRGARLSTRHAGMLNAKQCRRCWP